MASLTAVCGGVALGTATANAILTQRANDGSQSAILNGLIAQAPPGSGTVPGVYVPPSATGGRPEMYPMWGGVTPMRLTPAMAASILADVPGPPPIASAAYAAALLQTECAGGVRPPAAPVRLACAAAGLSPATATQAKAALFWNDPGGTIQPPGHWLQITNTVIQSQHLDTLPAARLSMLVSQAETDAGVLVWGVKYAENLWRPVTAIRNCASGATGGVTWNAFFNSCDGAWGSLISTPPHPDYLAGHPAFSGAAATVLANFFGMDAIPFTSVSDSYCNVGTAWRGATGTIKACTVGPASFLAYRGANTIYSLDGLELPAVCADIGGVYASAAQSCTLNGTPYVWSPSKPGCDSVVRLGGSNDSPLICPISESFTGFSDAVTGPYGSELSRVYGGIHTPFAAADATALGIAVGQAISAQVGIAEPTSLALMAVSLGLLARCRRISVRPPVPARPAPSPPRLRPPRLRRARIGETRDIRLKPGPLNETITRRTRPRPSVPAISFLRPFRRAEGRVAPRYV